MPASNGYLDIAAVIREHASPDAASGNRPSSETLAALRDVAEKTAYFYVLNTGGSIGYQTALFLYHCGFPDVWEALKEKEGEA
jgi:hypothetical protein